MSPTCYLTGAIAIIKMTNNKWIEVKVSIKLGVSYKGGSNQQVVVFALWLSVIFIC